ncbi:XTP/dITP diphosphohydrolase [Ruaniaceae bacterium KH17]|nr:XTP/dITP diphosphohydrolase [Ruaniaceae bacterium KH17]
MSHADSTRREDAIELPAGARIILATANSHKTGELRAILSDVLAPYGTEALISMRGLPLGSPVEDGVTFEENALIKARAAARATGLPALADDSGIAVDVLGGAPGVFSARWAGSHGDDIANLELLLDQLSDIPQHHRQARFVCAAVLVTPDGHEYVEQALVQGRLLYQPQGEGGFGYDPIFQPEGYARSMAELTPEEKNQISHRAKAFAELKEEIAAVLARG